jgi:membrane protein
MMDNVKNRLSIVYTHANRITGGSLGIIADAVKRFSNNHAHEAAASLSYYAFFSLFPLLIFLIVGISYVLEAQIGVEQLADMISDFIPISQDLIVRNVSAVLDQRGAVGLIALIGLLWSATGVFHNLVLNINRAWPLNNSVNVLRSRLVAVGMIAVIALIIILSFLSATLLELLPELLDLFSLDKSSFISPIWQLFTWLIPIILRLLILWALYTWVPRVKVKPIASLIGALISALAWELLSRGFTWYLSSGFATFELIYGSLGAVAALLIWVYLSSYIILLGAYLSASISEHLREKENSKETLTA